MRWITVNIRTFLLALVLATAVWISAVTAADPDEVRAYPNPIPLEIIGQDPSLVITSNIPSQIEVTLRAPRSVWEQLTAQEEAVRALLDLSGLSAGDHTLNIQIQVATRPTQIVLANPTSVTVTLEVLDTRTLIIDTSLQGQPAVGYQAGDMTLDSLSVIASGPKSLVKEAARARILVSVDGARENIDQAVPVQILDAKNNILRGLTVNPESVRVNIPVSQQGGFRDLAVKVAVHGQVASGYRLESISVFPPVVTVFASDPALVNSLPGVVDTAPFDLQDANEDVSTRLALILPNGVSVVGVQTVQVQAGVEPIQSSLTLSGQTVNVIGLPSELIVKVSPQTVDVILSGPLPVLDALTPQDVRVIADVSGLNAGTHQLEPTVEILAANIKVESILPSTVEVILDAPAAPTPRP